MKILKYLKSLCLFGHSWVYGNELHACTIEGKPHRNEINVKVRECQNCYFKQHGMMPIFQRKRFWKNFNKKSNEILIITKIQ